MPSVIQRTFHHLLDQHQVKHVFTETEGAHVWWNWRDYLVDYDAQSRTGHAILYGTAAPFEIEAAVRRALMLRADGDLWTPLVKTLLTSAPRWSATAASITEIADQYLANA